MGLLHHVNLGVGERNWIFGSLGAIPSRPKANLHEVIMTALQMVIKMTYKGSRYFLIQF